jgi:hypothetical protein
MFPCVRKFDRGFEDTVLIAAFMREIADPVQPQPDRPTATIVRAMPMWHRAAISSTICKSTDPSRAGSRSLRGFQMQCSKVQRPFARSAGRMLAWQV